MKYPSDGFIQPSTLRFLISSSPWFFSGMQSVPPETLLAAAVFHQKISVQT